MSLFHEAIPRYPDLEVQDEGTIFLLRPLTDRGARWIGKHIDKEAMTYWHDGVAVEHRYIRDIVEGALADGLAIDGWAKYIADELRGLL